MMPSNRRFKIRQVLLQGRFVPHGQGTVAGRTLQAAFGSALLHQTTGIVDELQQISSRTIFSRSTVETVQAVLQIGGITDLAHFTVTYQINSDLHLPGHDIIHGLGYNGVKFRLVIRLAPIFFMQQRNQVVRPWQAAHVGCENTIR